MAYLSMKENLAVRQMSRSEKETETEATRLIEHIKDALDAVAIRTTAEIDTLEAVADRIERAARDLSVALRELAHERRIAQDMVE
jgi:truncated hemoglobin YjbI